MISIAAISLACPIILYPLRAGKSNFGLSDLFNQHLHHLLLIPQFPLPQQLRVYQKRRGRSSTQRLGSDIVRVLFNGNGYKRQVFNDHFYLVGDLKAGTFGYSVSDSQTRERCLHEEAPQSRLCRRDSQPPFIGDKPSGISSEIISTSSVVIW
jgi:hypothetical protein